MRAAIFPRAFPIDTLESPYDLGASAPRPSARGRPQPLWSIAHPRKRGRETSLHSAGGTDRGWGR